MDEELAEKVCGVVLEAASRAAETSITVADALGLCVVALALACDAGAQRTGASELRSRLSQTLVNALIEVGRALSCERSQVTEYRLPMTPHCTSGWIIALTNV